MDEKKQTKGNIGITTDNIFPVIKKFLYSDHDIFLRELVSNAVDATQKLKTLAMKGDFKGEMGDLTVHISLDKDKGTLTVSDRGIGMTADEVEKYINQIAFSGANDFLAKYKDDANAIIGHFGLGFYSAFMVASKVEIVTKSHQENMPAVRWQCDGSPSYEMEECDKSERGTDIILHIDKDCAEFLEKERISQLLKKYCRFLPVPIAFGKKTEWKDGKSVETDEDLIVNDVNPLWTKQPSTLKDEDYKKFYSELYPMSDEPLFWIHLNVEYPFHLTGVLYFPKIKSNIDIHRNKIQLYCNQVYVTDEVDNIVPDFLTLLHGVIDSPDIPLNVSRSYLQSDSNVKKISTYITKKVADRLQLLFKEDRKAFEGKWDDLKLFIDYGMLSQPDFFDKAKAFALLKDVDGKFFTYDEYKELIKENQTDKDGNLVYLYASDVDSQYSYIEMAKAKGYSVLLLDGQLDTALVGTLEQKFEKSRFSRVDGDTIDRLIVKDNNDKGEAIEANDATALSGIFSSQMPSVGNSEFNVEVQPLGENVPPVMITQSEYMRRMKEMSKYQEGMSFYGQMPTMYNVVLNSDHRLIKEVLDGVKAESGEQLAGIADSLKELESKRKELQDAKVDDKEKDGNQEDIKKLSDEISSKTSEREALLSKFGKSSDVVLQLIDLALLQNGLLKGEALDRFMKRSIDIIK